MQMKRKILIFIAIFIIILLGLLSSMTSLITMPLSFLSFPANTQTKSGTIADPVNIAFIGNKEAIIFAFRDIHWIAPDPINGKTIIKIIEKSIKNDSYPSAPISNLYLFGRKEDFAFELPTQTVRSRHHVRLWQTNEKRFGLPLWVGSATYDSSIELNHRNEFPTHHVDANVDQERDFLTQFLINSDKVNQITHERITLPILLGYNGNGDRYFDDGTITVLQLKP